MGSDVESDPTSIPKLPLFSIPPHLPEPSGTLTPPLQTSVSVPFRWEEHPGKPRPCTDIILIAPTNRTLDLPPRLAALVESKLTTTKTSSSPTTVLDGPGEFGGKSIISSSSSFRFSKERRRGGLGQQRQGSFDSGSNCSGGWSPKSNDDEVILLSGNKHEEEDENNGGRGIFGSFRLRGTFKPPKAKGGNSKNGKGNCVISPSSIDTGFFDFEGEEEEQKEKGKRMRRNSSLSKLTRSHFWATIYEGFRQVVVPWRKKPKKESFTL